MTNGSAVQTDPAAEDAMANPSFAQPSLMGAWRGLWLITWRRLATWRRLPIQLAVFLTIPCLTGYTVSDGDSEAFYVWTVDFYLLTLVPLYCLFTCGAIVRDEVQADTLGFLITRPLSRVRLLLLQYICQATWLEIAVAVNGLLLYGVGMFKHIPGIHAAGWLLLGTQFLAVLAYGALSTLLGLIHSRYIVLGLVYGLVVEIGIGKIPTNINSLSLSHHVQTMLANLDAIENLYSWSPSGTFFSVMMMALATVMFLALAAALFTFREYHHSEEMQK